MQRTRQGESPSYYTVLEGPPATPCMTHPHEDIDDALINAREKMRLLRKAVGDVSEPVMLVGPTDPIRLRRPAMR